MKDMTIQEVREKLAEQDAENTEARTLYDVFLDGCPGYANTDEDECVDYLVQRGEFLDLQLADEDSVVVGHILDDKGNVCYLIEQCCNENSFKKV